MLNRFIFYLFLLFIGYVLYVTPLGRIAGHWSVSFIALSLIVSTFFIASKHLGFPSFTAKTINAQTQLQDQHESK